MSYDGLINLYSNKNLKRVNITKDFYTKYKNEFENLDCEYFCIGNLLICNVYVV